MSEPDNNVCWHLHLSLLHTLTDNGIKEQNKTQPETLEAHFDRTPH